jgi:predicted nucleotidyltransferase
MPANIRELLAELKQGFVQIYRKRLKAVYLFGSYARGDYNENSDLDVEGVQLNLTRDDILESIAEARKSY